MNVVGFENRFPSLFGGTGAAMGVVINDVVPASMAQRLRDLASDGGPRFPWRVPP